jgi:hypothetical protein
MDQSGVGYFRNGTAVLSQTNLIAAGLIPRSLLREADAISEVRHSRRH